MAAARSRPEELLVVLMLMGDVEAESDSMAPRLIEKGSARHGNSQHNLLWQVVWTARLLLNSSNALHSTSKSHGNCFHACILSQGAWGSQR